MPGEKTKVLAAQNTCRIKINLKVKRGEQKDEKVRKKLGKSEEIRKVWKKSL